MVGGWLCTMHYRYRTLIATFHWNAQKPHSTFQQRHQDHGMDRCLDDTVGHIVAEYSHDGFEMQATYKIPSHNPSSALVRQYVDRYLTQKEYVSKRLSSGGRGGR